MLCFPLIIQGRLLKFLNVSSPIHHTCRLRQVVWLRNPGRTLIYEDNRAMELKEKLRSSKAKYRLEETPKTVLLAHNSYILLVVYLILCPESLPLQMMNWDIKIEAPTKWQRREVDPRTTMELLRRRKMKMKTPKVHSRSLIVTSPCAFNAPICLKSIAYSAYEYW